MSLERLEITPFPVIVGELVQNRRTGYLTVVKSPVRKVMYWSQGELIMMTSSQPEDSLAELLVRRGVIPADRAAELVPSDPADTAARFHEASTTSLSSRQALLRDWIAAQFTPVFSYDEGTAAFTDDDALAPEKRVFLQSTAALVIEGIRSITNGLVLRRSLGDLKQMIALSRSSRFHVDSLPLTEPERRIASSMTAPMTIDAFIKQFIHESGTAAKVTIAMMALGVFEPHVEPEPVRPVVSFDDMQRDMEILAALGGSDPGALQAFSFSRQLATKDHYQVLDIPRAATRAQAISQGELLRRRYDPGKYPAVLRDSMNAVLRRIDEAISVLKDPVRRAAYDRLLGDFGNTTDDAIKQRVLQQSLAAKNVERARELSAESDYYGAILLLKQVVRVTPDNADAWFLLGSCQERNPQWRRDAAESFQRALSIDPNHVNALISLGDIYKGEGLTSRAQNCYEDALRIEAENPEAKSRLQALKKK
jgi:tetratricopeptide (TPR) repeat protein